MHVEPGAEFADFRLELSDLNLLLPNDFGQFRTLGATGGGWRHRFAHTSVIGREVEVSTGRLKPHQLQLVPCGTDPANQPRVKPTGV